MKSITKIKKQARRKMNIGLVETIQSSAKNENWKSVSTILSMPRRKRINLNLNEIGEMTKDGEIIVVPGKVLSQGELNKKIKIIALAFSENAMEKLLKNKISFSTIDEEIKSNPDAKGVRILR